jgi:hypothetical protein
VRFLKRIENTYTVASIPKSKKHREFEEKLAKLIGKSRVPKWHSHKKGVIGPLDPQERSPVTNLLREYAFKVETDHYGNVWFDNFSSD